MSTCLRLALFLSLLPLLMPTCEIMFFGSWLFFWLCVRVCVCVCSSFDAIALILDFRG